MHNNSIDIRGEINQAVIMTLVELIANTLGNDAVEMLLKRLQKKGELEGRALVIAFSEEVEHIYGSQGAYAILRQVGRDLSAKMIADSDPESYQSILTCSLNDMGFAEGIEAAAGHADICHCVFYEQIQQRSREPIEHPVCWAGWDLLKGSCNRSTASIILNGKAGIKRPTPVALNTTNL